MSLPTGYPYFRWWVKDAEADEFYLTASDAELGFYHRCLNRSWNSGGLPVDPSDRAKLLGKSRAYSDKMWKKIGRKFSPSEKDASRLVNGKQEQERSFVEARSAKNGAASAQRDNQKTPGFIYLISRSSDGAVKIGSSSHVQRRLAQLKYKYRSDHLELVGSFPVASMGDAELALHGKYSGKRVTGEWFLLSGGDIDITLKGDDKGDKPDHPKRQAYGSGSDSDSSGDVSENKNPEVSPGEVPDFLETGSVDLALIQHPTPLEVWAEVEPLYVKGGVPTSDKHRESVLRYICDAPVQKRHRIANYVKWAFVTGRWPSPAKTKGFFSLMASGDWDVELTQRVLPDAVQHTPSRAESAHEQAMAKFRQNEAKRGTV